MLMAGVVFLAALDRQLSFGTSFGPFLHRQQQHEQQQQPEKSGVSLEQRQSWCQQDTLWLCGQCQQTMCNTSNTA
jgi:hypothetical protein